MPNGNEYKSGAIVVFAITLSKLIDMSMGVNNEIINYSKFYKLNIFIIPIFALIVIITNLIFIPIYGINGAAIASLFSIILYNLSRFLIIKVKLKLSPFNKNTLKVLLILLRRVPVSVLMGVSGVTLGADRVTLGEPERDNSGS